MNALPAPIIERCIGRIDPARPLLFSVLAKQTFDVADGGLEPCESQEPFCQQEEEAGASDNNFNPGPVRRVPEITPDRDLCDVIVVATARSPRPVTSTDVLFSAPGISQRLRVIGDRVVEGEPGDWHFSRPQPWDEMPLGWDRAYGGIDRGVLPDPSNKEGILRALICHPGAYPRNDVGRGFSVKGSHLPSKGMPLPNVEDARDLLTPERFDCPEPRLWHLQPLPAGLGCMPAHWFQRSICLGVVPGEWPHQKAGGVPEEASGFLPRGFVEEQRRRGVADAIISPQFFQVSAPGMRARLKGNERLALQGVDGERALTVDLPGRPPRLVLRIPRGDVALNPRLFQVRWDVDDKRLTMIWGAGLPLDDQALKGLSGEELLATPLTAG